MKALRSTSTGWKSGRAFAICQAMTKDFLTPGARAKFSIGQVVRHRIHPFRGVIFDVDPTFSNTEDWWEAIPEGSRPRRDQPFYHLYAENETSYYVAYVSEQNLVPDDSGEPIDHPALSDTFSAVNDGRYKMREGLRH